MFADGYDVEMDLSTPRLRIRMMREADAAIITAYRNDPEIAAMQDWDLPYPLERARERLAEQATRDDIAQGEWTTFAVEVAGEVAGDVACHLDLRGAIAEVGYTFRREFQGQGYAREAAAALVDHILATTSVHRIEASLDPENVGSMRVLESLGMVFESLSRKNYFLRNAWYDDMRYAMLRDDRAAWLARPTTPPTTLDLVEITPDDAHLWGAVVTHRSQERFVSPVARSYRNALFPEVVGGAPVVPWMRGVLADGERVGFVMLADVTARHPEPFLWRLLVDRMHQRRGVGSMILTAVCARLHEQGHRSLLTSWHTGPGGPEPFYVGKDFVATGRVVDDEVEARLSW
jgi:RimJ/RimL family protein N-acetyltransferase